jgi:hypothetical protein
LLDSACDVTDDLRRARLAASAVDAELALQLDLPWAHAIGEYRP